MAGRTGSRREGSTSLEVPFLVNYLFAASNLRVATCQPLREKFHRPDAGETEKRLLFFGIHQQMCMAIEDLGALMFAFREKAAGRDFMNSLAGYRRGAAYMFNLLKEKKDQDIAAEFGLAGAVPSVLQKSGYDEARQERAARNFVEHFRSVAHSQATRMAICNKLKHGGTVYYDSDNRSGLAVLDNDGGTLEPIWFSFNETELQTILYIVATCSHQSKELAFRYLVLHHPHEAEKLLQDKRVWKEIERASKLVKDWEPGRPGA